MALFGSETPVLHKVLPQRAAEARGQGLGVVFSNALSPVAFGWDLHCRACGLGFLVWDLQLRKVSGLGSFVYTRPQSCMQTLTSVIVAAQN